MKYNRAVGKVMELFQSGAKEEAPEELVSSYQKRLFRQRDIYGRWIQEKEPDLWRQWEETLQDGQADGGRSCLILPYGALAGITELSQIINAGAADSQEERMPDILLFAENPEDLDERAVPFVKNWFGTEPTARLLYGAEDHREGEERRFPWFKPCFSPDTLLGFFYFGSYFAVDRAWAMGTHLAGHEDARRNLYDFMLRLLRPYYERETLAVCRREYKEIACTDLILYHRSGPAAFRALEDTKRFLYYGEMRGEANTEFWGYEREYLGCRQDLVNSICGACEPYQTKHPDVWSLIPGTGGKMGDNAILVSVVIPSKDHPGLLIKCIRSFVKRTSLPGLRERVEFIVVDNGSEERNRRIIQNFLDFARIRYRYLYKPMAFNFSVMCNMGAEQAEGTYILLLNDDIEIIQKDWLRILLGQAEMPGMGAIGAKLWYPNGDKIQHAGVTNMSDGPSHKLGTFSDSRCYYYGHNTVTYDMIAVTGACLLVKRSIYEEVGGLDKEMAVAYNDVDFCFTLAEMGLRNVIRNDAVLRHHESASRGLDRESAEKRQRLSEEKAKLYEKHPRYAEWDPYYSSQFAGDTADYYVRVGAAHEQPLQMAEEVLRQDKKASLQKVHSGRVMLTIDQVRARNDVGPGEPDILELEGWCCMMGWDNCLFERYLILEARREDFYYQFPAGEHFRPDVKVALPEQKNIELSGFICGVNKEMLSPGSYTVGILYRNLCDGRLFYGRSSKSLQI